MPSRVKFVIGSGKFSSRTRRDTVCRKENAILSFVPGAHPVPEDAAFYKECNDNGTGYDEPVLCPEEEAFTYCDEALDVCVSVVVECPVTNCMETMRPLAWTAYRNTQQQVHFAMMDERHHWRCLRRCWNLHRLPYSCPELV